MFAYLGQDIALLVNNLGATTNMEMSIAVRSAVRYLEEEVRYHVGNVVYCV